MMDRPLAVAMRAAGMGRPFFCIGSHHSPSSLLMLVSGLFIMRFGFPVMVSCL